MRWIWRLDVIAGVPSRFVDRWKDVSVAVPVGGLVDAGSVLVGMTPGYLIAFDKASGQTAWEISGQYRGRVRRRRLREGFSISRATRAPIQRRKFRAGFSTSGVAQSTGGGPTAWQTERARP